MRMNEQQHSQKRAAARWLQGLLCLVLLHTSVAGATDASAPVDIDPAVIDALSRALAKQADQPDRYDAQVWLLSSVPKIARWVDNDAERTAILTNVYRESNRHQIDPDLVMSVMQVESAFNRFAVSSAGAQGLMQVMPFWRSMIGRPQDNLTEIDTNVRYGTAILAQYLTETRGDLIDALARYNGSRGRLDYPELVVRAYRGRWQTQSTEDLPTLRAGCLAYTLAACSPLARKGAPGSATAR
jgi:soluble lytic murein transglycosylase-like protein